MNPASGRQGGNTQRPAPQDVDYLYAVNNRIDPAMAIDNVTLTDNQCPNVVRPVPYGEQRRQQAQPGEEWDYTCTMRHGPGSFNNTAKACASSSSTSAGRRRSADEDVDRQFTTRRSPHRRRSRTVAVKPAAVVQPPCTLSTPSGLRVRAGQLNTIRVRVRNVDAGSTVTLTLPGTKKKVTAKTNASGVAVLRVRPTRSGTASIKRRRVRRGGAPECPPRAPGRRAAEPEGHRLS